jgi:integrase
MAWIEERGGQHRVYTRANDGKKIYEPFACSQDAELFIAFITAHGWDTALAAVRRAPETPPAPLPARAHLLTSSRGETHASKPTPVVPHKVFPSRMDAPAPIELRPAGLTVGELVRWHIAALTDVEPATITQYEGYVRDYVDPFFGDLDAGYVIGQPNPYAQGTCAMAATQWRTWLAEQQVITPTGRPTGRTLSKKSIKNIMNSVSATYKVAMADDFHRLVDRNPFQGRANKVKGQDTTERTFLTPEHVRVMYEALLPAYRLMFMFLVLTGLRWSEFAGLRVRDVCLDPHDGRAYLEVKVGVQKIQDGVVTLGRLKSQAARRRLTLPVSLVEPLRALMADKKADDPVFTSAQGKPLHHSNVSREFDRAIKRARDAGHEAPYFRPHSLRHTCAAWLLSAGRTLYQVSKQLGHETEATTGRYYGHLLSQNRDENADTLDAMIGKEWSMAEHCATDVMVTGADLELPELGDKDMNGFESEAA